MKKRLISTLLMGAFVVASTSMFVSCKDYDDDINNLQEQIDKNADAIKQIQNLIASGSVITSVDDIANGVKVTLSNGKSFNVTNGVNGTDGKNGTVWTIGDDGYWYQDGTKTNYQALGKDGKDGKDGINGKDGKDGKDGVDGKDGKDGKDATGTGNPGDPGQAGQNGKYYVPNPETGCFDIYQDGELVESTNISFIASGAITATLDGENLTIYGVRGATGPNNSVTISLSANLKSMVFVPHLYLDGIESIEYPWIGDTILQKLTLASEWKNLSHHGTEVGGVAKDRQDLKDLGWDFIPNTLGRYYSTADNQIHQGFLRGTVDGNAINWGKHPWGGEWIYGPAWEIEYHLNPSTSAVDYDTNAPSFNVLEPDVVYYNTRAAASALNITSPKEFYKIWKTNSWRNNSQVFRKDGSGILYVGIQIANPNKLAPWPTDETINPNGNTDSKVSYPANQKGGNEPFAGDKTEEAYGNYGSWYGFSRYEYNKNNTDNTVALQMHKTEGDEDMITSDYALIVPTHVQLEGLIWDKHPQYIEPAMPGYPEIGPNREDNPLPDRIGDEEGWAADENGDCSTKRIHVWDSPQEALADPAGAALELYCEDAGGVDLKPYLGIHYLRENLKKRETAPGVYNQMVYDIKTLHYGDEAAWGLHYEFELVDYISSTNNTHDSRYATFTDVDNQPLNIDGNKVITNWNSKPSRNGVIVAKSVNADGKTIDVASTTSVDREPLVRVMVKNEKGQVLLDGYILLHINYTPLNLVVDNYPEYKRTFNLCDPVKMTTTWSEFSKYILQDKLAGRFVTDDAVQQGMEVLSFDDYYWADCKTGGTVDPQDVKYVTPNAFNVAPAGTAHDGTGITNTSGMFDGHMRGYQLRLWNFGNDIYGNGGMPPARGSVAWEHENTFEKSAFPNDPDLMDKELGAAVYYPNGEGTTNHMFEWFLAEEELEYLTHDENAKNNTVTVDGKEYVKVTRWFRFVAKDEVRGREVNNLSAPYPYIWVKMTMLINRDHKTLTYVEKIDNYWYHYMTGNQNGWSGIIFDIEAPRDGRTIQDQRWVSKISSTMTADGVENHFKLESQGNYCGHAKYYFAPKTYKITAMNGNTYTITPKNGNYSQDVYGVKVAPNTNTWDQLFCKYVKAPECWRGNTPAHNYDFLDLNNSEWHSHANHNGPVGTNLIDFNPQMVVIKVAQDKHTWNESTLEETLKKCAIRYNDGVFNDTILYAERNGQYTPIARLVKYEQYINDRTTWYEAGDIELIHWLPIGSNQNTGKENVVLYDVLNALGYPTKADGSCDFDNSRKYINKQFRAWVGVVANNGCDVALYVKQGNDKQPYDKFDAANDFEVKSKYVWDETEYLISGKETHTYDPVATFLTSWERPINVKPIDPEYAIDATQNENVVYLIDYLKFYDWRGDYTKQGYMYDDPDILRGDNHWWYWPYYNVKGVMVDMRPSKIITNMHKEQRAAANEWVTLDRVTTQARLWAYPQMTATQQYYGEYWDGLGNRQATNHGLVNASGVNYVGWGLANHDMNGVPTWEFYYKNKELDIEAFMMTHKEIFGAFYYENNGDNVTEFDVVIPITVFYEWGSFENKILWHINTTHGRTND